MEIKENSLKNLKPLDKMDQEEARAIRSAGGKACWAKKKERQRIADSIRALLDEETEPGSGTTRQEALVAATIRAAFRNPNVRNLKTLAELLGELETVINSEGITLNIKTSEDAKGDLERLLNED